MPASALIALSKLTPEFVGSFLKAYETNRDDIPVNINALQCVAHYSTQAERIFQLHLRLEAAVVAEINAIRQQLALPELSKQTNQQDLQGPVELLSEAFSQRNAALEMWSAVYHRFFAPYPDSIKGLCAAAGVNKRRFYRRRDDGLDALAHILVMAEVEARQEIRGVQLYERLPLRTYSTLLGRDELITELRLLIDNPHGPRIISLEGLAGIGKTAVARQLATDLTDVGLIQGLAWINLSTVEINTNGQLVPNTNMVRTVPGVIESIIQQFDFGEVLGGMPPQVQAGRLRDALSEGTNLVVLDGLETLDDPAALLELLYPLTLRVVFVITTRRSLGNMPGVLVRALPGLSEKASYKLFVETCNQYQVVCDLHPEQIRALHHFAEGRPGLLYLLADYLRKVSIHDLLEMLEAERLPYELLDRLSIWFESQLRALSGDARQLLTVLCCVVENGERREWVKFVANLPPERLALAEQLLATYCFITRHANLSSYSQIRIPPLLRAYLKGQLLRLRDNPEWTPNIRDKQAWLMRCAVSLRQVLRQAPAWVDATDRVELLDGQGLNRYYLLLEAAQEWTSLRHLALDLILALHPLPLHNGDWKRWRHEMSFAANCLHELERYEEQARILNSLAVVHFHSGKWDSLLNTCEAILTLSHERDLPIAMTRASYTAVDAFYYLGQHSEVPDYLARVTNSPVLAQAEGLSASIAFAWLCLTRAIVYRAEGKLELAYEQTIEAERLLVDAGSPDIHMMGTVYQHQGLMLWALGRYKEAELQLQYAHHIFIDIDDIFTQAFVEGNLGLLNWSMGKLVSSMNHTTDSLSIARMVEANWHVAAQTGNLALLQLYKGDLNQAFEKVTQHKQLATDQEITLEIHRANINRGAILFHRSRFAEALSALERGRKIEGLSPMGKACLLVYLARVYAHRYRKTDAWQCIEEVTAIMDSTQSPPLKIIVLRTKAEITHDEDKARKWLREALILSEDTNRDFDRAACLLSLAALEPHDSSQVYWHAGAALLAGMDADKWLEGASSQKPPVLPTLI